MDNKLVRLLKEAAIQTILDSDKNLSKLYADGMLQVRAYTRDIGCLHVQVGMAEFIAGAVVYPIGKGLGQQMANAKKGKYRIRTM